MNLFYFLWYYHSQSLKWAILVLFGCVKILQTADWSKTINTCWCEQQQLCSDAHSDPLTSIIKSSESLSQTLEHKLWRFCWCAEIAHVACDSWLSLLVSCENSFRKADWLKLSTLKLSLSNTFKLFCTKSLPVH